MAVAGLTHRDRLERVPWLLADCAREWELRLGAPYAAGAAGHAVRVELPALREPYVEVAGWLLEA